MSKAKVATVCGDEISLPVTDSPTCQSIDWYSEGESRTIQVGDVLITVRYVGRNGRRGRIVIEAPAGAVFGAVDAGNY